MISAVVPQSAAFIAFHEYVINSEALESTTLQQQHLYVYIL
jgi:hypothetical protein